MSAPRARARALWPALRTPRWVALGLGPRSSSSPAVAGPTAPRRRVGRRRSADGHRPPDERPHRAARHPRRRPEPELAGRSPRHAGSCRAPTRSGSPAARTIWSSADVWDSGKVDSDDQTDVVVRRPRPTAATRTCGRSRCGTVRSRPPCGATPPPSRPVSSTRPTGATPTGSAGPPSGEVDRWTDYTADIDFDIDKLALGVSPGPRTPPTRTCGRFDRRRHRRPEVPPPQARQRRLHAARQQADHRHHVGPAAGGHAPPVRHGRRQHHHHPPRREPDRPAHRRDVREGLRRLPPGSPM